MAQETNIKQFIESTEYQQRRSVILAEINSDQVKIDRLCFKKTDAEKSALKEMKKQWKNINQ